MAVSEAVIQRLEELKANIQAFLNLHKNPYDSSQYNDLAERLERIESILANIQQGGNPNTGDDSGHSCNTGGDDMSGDTSGGDDSNADTSDGMGGDTSGGDDNNTDTSDGMGGDTSGGDDNNTDSSGGDSALDTLKTALEQAREGARAALATVEDLNAAQITIEDSEKAKIEAYVAKADEFLQAYQSADDAAKNAFDQANDGYVAEIQQSRDWNANSFLPKTEGGGDGSGASDDSTGDNSTDTSNLSRSISASVGKGGTNKQEDVDTVRGWLNSHGARIEATGPSDNKLINEIKKFQRRLGSSRPDGRVDPGKNTWKGLIGEKPVGPPSTGVSSIIQGGESGAAGYNAYNRGTRGNSIVGPNGHRELVAMTLATIMTNQSRPKNHAEYLFAVGKYQMIPATLKEGVRALNLDTSLKYDPATQELLFSGYLMDKKRPQISAYIKGLPGNSAFKAGLAGAQEWASIAVPEGHAKAGRSFYDGIGGNSAHITAADFLSALDEAKADYQKFRSQGMSDADAYKAAVSGVESTANSGGSGDGNDTGSGSDTGSGNDTGSGSNTGGGSRSITASVGAGGVNNEADVRTVQELLNGKGAKLTVDGKNGNNTETAIRSFQRSLGQNNPDGRVDPGKNTWKGLIGSGGSVDSNAGAGGNASSGPDDSLDQGGSDFSHANHASIKLTYGGRAVKLNARAEKLLKSILAACGIPSAHLTSTLRTYHDQARITKTQTLPNSGAGTVARWYGQPVLDATRRMSVADLAVWWRNYDKQRGRVSSKHLSNIAMDVVPAHSRSRFASKVQELAAASGTNVRRIIPKGVMNEPVDHVEFMFEVTNKSA
jgi:hypothetical protein